MEYRTANDRVIEVSRFVGGFDPARAAVDSFMGSGLATLAADEVSDAELVIGMLLGLDGRSAITCARGYRAAAQHSAHKPQRKSCKVKRFGRQRTEMQVIAPTSGASACIV